MIIPSVLRINWRSFEGNVEQKRERYYRRLIQKTQVNNGAKESFSDAQRRLVSSATEIDDELIDMYLVGR